MIRALCVKRKEQLDPNLVTGAWLLRKHIACIAPTLKPLGREINRSIVLSSGALLSHLPREEVK